MSNCRSDSEDVGWGLRFHISNKFPVEADVAGPGPHSQWQSDEAHLCIFVSVFVYWNEESEISLYTCAT